MTGIGVPLSCAPGIMTCGKQVPVSTQTRPSQASSTAKVLVAVLHSRGALYEGWPLMMRGDVSSGFAAPSAIRGADAHLGSLFQRPHVPAQRCPHAPAHQVQPGRQQRTWPAGVVDGMHRRSGISPCRPLGLVACRGNGCLSSQRAGCQSKGRLLKAGVGCWKLGLVVLAWAAANPARQELAYTRCMRTS